MPYNVVGNVECLYLAFVPIKEVFTYVGIFSHWVWLPFHIGIAQKVHIHRVGSESFFYKVGTSAVFVQKPNFGNDEFGIKEYDIAPISLRYPSVNP